MNRFGKILATVLAVFFLFPNRFYAPVHFGLDTDVGWSLVRAWELGLRFGSEFILTYGPLGFLSLRPPVQGFIWAYLLNDLLIFSSSVYVLGRSFERSPKWDGMVAIVLISFALSSRIFEEDVAVAYFLLGVFFILDFWAKPHWVKGGLSGLFATLAFLTKFSYGLAAVVLLLGAFGVCAFRSRDRLVAITSIVVMLGFLILGGHFCQVDFISYFRNFSEIARGYSDGMSYVGESKGLEYLVAGVVTTAGVGLLVALWERRKGSGDSFGILVIVTIAFAVLSKQSLVREDALHLLVGLRYIGPLMAFAAIFVPTLSKPTKLLMLGLPLGLSAAMGLAYMQKGGLRSEVLGPGNYIKGISSVVELDSITTLRAQSLGEIGSSIKGKTVDWLPDHLADAYFSGGDWRPRPIPLSYSAYTPRLDQINADYFASERAPQFVVLRSDCIDGRYCFADEPLARREIFSRYDFRAEVNGLTLLERHPRGRALTESELKAEPAKLGAEIPIPPSPDLVMLRAEFSLSLLGQLKRLVLRSPLVHVEFKLVDGATQTFRIVPEAWTSGVPVSRLVEGTDGFASFFDGRFERLPEIKSIKFTVDELWAFNPNIALQFSTLKIGAWSAP